MLCRALCVFAVCCFALLIALANNTSASEANDDLQGAWQAVDGEVNGKKLPADQVDELQVVIKADKLEIKPDGEGRKTTFKLDSNGTPKTIDLTPLDGNRKGTIVPGIYSLQDGELKLCINIWGKDPAKRPTEFKAQEGDGFVFATFQRKKQE
jgi:uncharacterized protein (TIGR03067 family)